MDRYNINSLYEPTNNNISSLLEQVLPSWSFSRKQQSEFYKVMDECYSIMESFKPKITRYAKGNGELGLFGIHKIYTSDTYPSNMKDYVIYYNAHDMMGHLPDKYQFYKTIIKKDFNLDGLIRSPFCKFNLSTEMYKLEFDYQNNAIESSFNMYFEYDGDYRRRLNYSNVDIITIPSSFSGYYLLTSDKTMMYDYTDYKDYITEYDLNSDWYLACIDINNNGMFDEDDYLALKDKIGKDIDVFGIDGYVLDIDGDGLFSKMDYEILYNRINSVKTSGIYLKINNTSNEDINITVFNKILMDYTNNNIIRFNRSHNIIKINQLPNGEYLFLENGNLSIISSDLLSEINITYPLNKFINYPVVIDYEKIDNHIYCVVKNKDKYCLCRFNLYTLGDVVLLMEKNELFYAKPLQDDKLLILTKDELSVYKPIYHCAVLIDGTQYYLSEFFDNNGNSLCQHHKNVQPYDLIGNLIGLDRFKDEEPYQFLNRIRQYIHSQELKPTDCMAIYLAMALDEDDSVNTVIGKVTSDRNLNDIIVFTIFGNNYYLSYDEVTGYLYHETTKVGRVLNNIGVLYNTIEKFVTKTGTYDCNLTFGNLISSFTVTITKTLYRPLTTMKLELIDEDVINNSDYYKELYKTKLFSNKDTLGNLIHGLSTFDTIDYDKIYPYGINLTTNSLANKQQFTSSNMITDSLSFSEPETFKIRVPKVNEISVIDNTNVEDEDITKLRHFINDGDDLSYIYRVRTGVVHINGETYHYLGRYSLKYGYEIEELNPNYVYFRVKNDIEIDNDIDKYVMVNDKYIIARVYCDKDFINSDYILIDEYPFIEKIIDKDNILQDSLFITFDSKEDYTGSIYISRKQNDYSFKLMLQDNIYNKYDNIKITNNIKGLNLYNSNSNSILSDMYFDTMKYQTNIKQNETGIYIDNFICMDYTNNKTTLYTIDNVFNDTKVLDKSLKNISFNLIGLLKQNILSLYVDDSYIDFNKIISYNNGYVMQDYLSSINVKLVDIRKNILNFQYDTAIPPKKELFNWISEKYKTQGYVLLDIVIVSKSYFYSKNNEDRWASKDRFDTEYLSADSSRSFIYQNNLFDTDSTAYKYLLSRNLLNSNSEFTVLCLYLPNRIS